MRKHCVRIALIVVVSLLAGALRWHAANHLLIDGDESTYINAALDYADALRAGDWKAIAWYDENREHPALNKLLYGVVLLGQPPLETLWPEDYPDYTPIAGTEGRPWGIAGRYASAALGGLAVLVLSLLNPVAGLLLAVHTFAVRFSSGFLLEALPFLTGLLAALFYLRWFDSGKKRFIHRLHRHEERKEIEGEGGRGSVVWLGLSAAALGATAASKYTYAVVGIAIGLHGLWFAGRAGRLRASLGWLVGWGLLTLAAFFVFDPYLWPKPLPRLIESLTFHAQYSQNEFVRGYPAWQPLVWLTSTYPGKFPNFAPAFWVALDPLITALALVGLPRTWQRRPLFVIWLAVGLVTVLLWPTKWPQYTLILLAPLCLAAAEGAGWVWDQVRGRFFTAKAQSI